MLDFLLATKSMTIVSIAIRNNTKIAIARAANSMIFITKDTQQKRKVFAFLMKS